MSIGLVGRKVGMTRIFTDDGGTLPVTVVDVSDNGVTQIKTAEEDGYAAVHVAFGKLRDKRRTISNLVVVRVDAERQLLLVKGSVPGSKGRDVLVRPAVKIWKPVVQQAKPAAPKSAPRPEAKPAEAKPAAKKS